MWGEVLVGSMIQSFMGLEAHSLLAVSFVLLLVGVLAYCAFY